VILVYNHFVSTAHQTPVAEVFLGDLSASPERTGASDLRGVIVSEAKKRPSETLLHSGVAPDYIVEPSAAELMELLQPRLLKLKFHAAILDSIASEHAARTVAMQTATDNGEDLLAELNLMYNKGRQQRITSEILDLAGGKVEE